MGRTLTLAPGASVVFVPGASLVANGRLIANGTSSNRITFTSTGGTTQQSWGSISISRGLASGSSLDYVNVQYGTRIEVLNATGVAVRNRNISTMERGILLDGSSSIYASILNNRITDCGQGVTVQNGANNVTINDNTICRYANQGQGIGLQFLTGSAKAGRNDIDYYGHGILASYNSTVYTYSPYSNGRNNRITGCTYGVMASEYSTAMFGTTPPSDYMWNTIRNNVYNGVAGSSAQLPSTVMAQGNYLGGTPTPSMFLVFPRGYINYSSYLASDPWGGIPLPSVQSGGGIGNRGQLLQALCRCRTVGIHRLTFAGG